MYRPTGWEKIKQSQCIHCLGIPEAGIAPATCETCPTEPMVCNSNGEALADAMLEGLRKESVEIDTSKKMGYLSDTIPVGVEGHLVFIPEDKKKKN